MTGKLSKRVGVLLAAMFMLVSVAACAVQPTSTQQVTTTTTTEMTAPSLMEYTFAFYDDSATKWMNNPNDVVTPFIEEKFNIRVKEVTIVKDTDFRERLTQWIASGTTPDVVCTGDFDFAVSSGQFAILDDYIDKMTNYNKYFDAKY